MRRVLLIDGDSAVRDQLTRALAPPRYALFYARTAAKGLDLARKRRPEVVICECLLPDSSGMHLLLRIRKELPSTAVFMISPYDLDWIRVSVLQAGAHQHLTKPLDPESLIGSLEALETAEQACGAAADELMEQAREFIGAHYSERLTLTRVAEHLGMDPFVFCRKFKAACGRSFREHLLQVRISRARELLADRRHTITEIAHMVGFGDLPRFDKMFKRATGSPPTVYRSAAVR